MRAGGITIEVGCEVDDEEVAGELVGWIEVRDSGTGIPPQMLGVVESGCRL